MWPFASRTSRADTSAPEPQDLPLFEDFKKSDATLKVWLPQKLNDRLGWMSIQLDASKPDIARTYLFEHLYGRVAFQALTQHTRKTKADAEVARVTQNAMRRNSLGTAMHNWVSDSEDAPALQPMFSNRAQTPADLAHIGRSDWDFTFTLPKRMLEDLRQVASLYDLTPSHYMRKMLVLELLGEKVHGQWQKAVGKISSDVAALERD
jgi:hypothetical protein